MENWEIKRRKELDEQLKDKLYTIDSGGGMVMRTGKGGFIDFQIELERQSKNYIDTTQKLYNTYTQDKFRELIETITYLSMEQIIKNIRVSADTLSKNLLALRTCQIPSCLCESQSKEIVNCKNSILLGKAWLGKMLGELGTPSPYQNEGKRKTVRDIEPTADTGKFEKITGKNEIELIDLFRNHLESIIVSVKDIDTKSTREFAIARTNAYTHFCEAKFWLGFDLQRIKEKG